MWNLNYYLKYDLRPENKQKTLNRAFYAALFQILIYFLLLAIGSGYLSGFGYLEIFGFLLFGYFTHKNSKKASFLLLFLFIVERILVFINLLTSSGSWANVYIFLLFTVILWKYYYHAYLYSQRTYEIKSENEITKLEAAVFANKHSDKKAKGGFLKVLMLVFIAFILFGFGFYWFQIRPSQIKHDCSWVEVHTDAIPAFSAIQASTPQEIAAHEKGIADCKIKGGYCSPFNYPDIHGFIPAKPAQPTKDWWKPASSQQYQFCLHDKGL